MWADGSAMALPSSDASHWYPGEPDNADSNQHCSLLTNYQYWTARKQVLVNYVWLDFNCDFFTANEIQGYICESIPTIKDEKTLNVI